MSDTLLDFCDALVAALNEAEKPLACAVSWQDDPIVDLAKGSLADPNLWIVDFASAHRTGQANIPVQELQILLIIQQRLGPVADRPAQCRGLAGLAGWIEDYCHTTPIANATCTETQRLPARDWAKYTDEGLYRSEILTHWQSEEDD